MVGWANFEKIFGGLSLLWKNIWWIESTLKEYFVGWAYFGKKNVGWAYFENKNAGKNRLACKNVFQALVRRWIKQHCAIIQEM